MSVRLYKIIHIITFTHKKYLLKKNIQLSAQLYKETVALCLTG